jgi:hypothetical protein
MNAKNIIFGTLALAIVGGGAYFYFKNKKKGSLADTLASSLSNTGSGTGTGTGTTPDKVLDNAPINTPSTQEETNKQIQAQGLATQITTLKSQFDTLQITPTHPYEGCSFESKPTTGADKGSMENYKNCDRNQRMISEKRKQITLLGYKENNGIAVKL